MHLSPSTAKTSLHIIKTSLVKPSISSAPPCQANKKGLMSICSSITFAYLNHACNYLERKMLDEVTKVCTLLWFNRKCSISASKNVLSYCINFWNEKKESLWLQRSSPRPREELRPLGAPATVPPPLPVRRSTAALFTDMEKFLCGDRHTCTATLRPPHT